MNKIELILISYIIFYHFIDKLTMSNTNSEYFEVTQDYAGKEGELMHFNLSKGDIVRFIKKELVWTTVEKDGHTIKVPNGMLRKCTSQSEAS